MGKEQGEVKKCYEIHGWLVIAASPSEASAIYRENFGVAGRVTRKRAGFSLLIDDIATDVSERTFADSVETFGGGIVQEQ